MKNSTQPVPQLLPINDLLYKTVKLFKDHYLFFLPIVIITYLISSLFEQILLPKNITYNLYYLALLILNIIIADFINLIGIATIIIVLTHNSKSYTIRNIIKDLRIVILPIWVANVLVGARVLLGLFAAIIPGLIFLFLLQFTNYIVIGEKVRGNSALVRSKILVKSYLFPILVRNLVIIIPGIIFSYLISISRIPVIQSIFGMLLVPFTTIYGYLLYNDVTSKYSLSVPGTD